MALSLSLCSCSYGHGPYFPLLLLWRVTLEAAALLAVQRIAFVGQQLYFTSSLALHHLSSAGHSAHPDTPALGLRLPVTVAKELSILSHSQRTALPSCQFKLCPSWFQAPRLSCNRTGTSDACHAPGDHLSGYKSPQFWKNLDEGSK